MMQTWAGVLNTLNVRAQFAILEYVIGCFEYKKRVKRTFHHDGSPGAFHS